MEFGQKLGIVLFMIGISVIIKAPPNAENPDRCLEIRFETNPVGNRYVSGRLVPGLSGYLFGLLDGEIHDRPRAVDADQPEQRNRGHRGTEEERLGNFYVRTIRPARPKRGRRPALPRVESTPPPLPRPFSASGDGTCRQDTFFIPLRNWLNNKGRPLLRANFGEWSIDLRRLYIYERLRGPTGGALSPVVQQWNADVEQALNFVEQLRGILGNDVTGVCRNVRNVGGSRRKKKKTKKRRTKKGRKTRRYK